MKKLAVVVAMYLAVTLLPLNLEAKILAQHQHRKWKSYVLATDKQVTARMVTTGVDDSESTLLIAEHYPNMCGKPLLHIISCQDAFKDTDYEGTATGSLRVDIRSIFDVEYLVEVADSCMVITTMSQSTPTIFSDLVAGAFVRFKINLTNSKDSEPIYKRYSLAGFTAAQKRTLGLCKELEEIQADVQQEFDSDFFKENRTPETDPEPTIKSKENDSDYFI